MLNKSLLEEFKKNTNLMYNEKFFNKLKSESLIDFRNNINEIESIDVSLYFENKIKEYYDLLLKEYDSETKLFKDYNILLNCFKNNNYDELANCTSDIFIFNSEIINILNDIKSEEELYNKLITITNQKISEIVIDGLFQDTYYNVIINIKEMLRYNEFLSIDEKILDKTKIDFYKRILEIDNMNQSEKIIMYNELKNNNINLEFYNDLRNLKNKCYNKLNNSLINLDEKDNLLNKELTEQNGVKIYDLRDEEYVMLIRTSDNFKETSDYRSDSYSVISNEKNNVYSGKFIYGYTNFDIDNIIHIFERDAGVKKIKDRNSVGTNKVNRLLTVDELIKTDKDYNEINIVNIKNDNNIFNTHKPDFLIVYDVIKDDEILEAKRLDIPIVIIKHQTLNKVSNNNISYFDNLDDYTNSDRSFLEETRRIYR